MNVEAPSKCLLCNSTDVSIGDRLTGAELIQLWKATGQELSDQAMGPITASFAVGLYRCGSCGFEFYDSQLAGSAEFYEELMSKRSYPCITKEFRFALNLAKTHGLKRVLDIGGGDGAFLDLACVAGMETHGMELNRDAARAAASKGHRMLDKPLEETNMAEIGRGFDLVTLFQVVEHVPNPVEFLSAAARLAKPGGYLVVGVPSGQRILGLIAHDPANWPPHHISRWQINDLKNLARHADLEWIDHSHDPLHADQISWAWNYHNLCMYTLGRKPLPGGQWLPEIIKFAYRYLGCKHYTRLHGLSMYAALRKPA